MSDGLIHRFEVTLAASACHPDAEWDVLFIKLYEDISDVLPYLNAELEQPTDYRQSSKILLWRSKGKKYAFRSHEIAITPVRDDKEAQELSNGIIETVNTIWKRKDDITPSFEERKPLPNVLDIYKLLPRSNCKTCGFPTCMAFSAGLRMDVSKLSLCPYLSEQDFDRAVSGHHSEPPL